MKAADVRIAKALDPGESYVDPSFLLVETTIDAERETVTTIEHLVNRSTDGGKPRWQLTTLGQSVPLSHAAALEWAVSFAASRNIPVVYERDDSTAAAHAHAAAPYAAASFSSASK